MTDNPGPRVFFLNSRGRSPGGNRGFRFPQKGLSLRTQGVMNRSPRCAGDFKGYAVVPGDADMFHVPRHFLKDDQPQLVQVVRCRFFRFASGSGRVDVPKHQLGFHVDLDKFAFLGPGELDPALGPPRPASFCRSLCTLPRRQAAGKIADVPTGRGISPAHE